MKRLSRHQLRDFRTHTDDSFAELIHGTQTRGAEDIAANRNVSHRPRLIPVIGVPGDGNGGTARLELILLDQHAAGSGDQHTARAIGSELAATSGYVRSPSQVLQRIADLEL